ncbi:sulfatase family protein [Spiribacter halobius]|uniref:Sulfatase N-terminal domain-containing protein n=1 Tax=Sediminicurvatus halobius TaxID=2182432 RepID=A0A2U2MXM1_9GAMM|nr:sulfatase [Spiribacter halobius]PWG61701.1 hypothetical protein DEM34_15180 [Spiribacter halobius]UEX77324.1 sulfatase [Spiribacter halobius]
MQPTEALPWAPTLLAAFAAGALVTVVVLLKSVKDFSQTGPQIRDEVLRLYFGYTLLSVARLGCWALALATLLALPGSYVYLSATVLLGATFSPVAATTSALAAVLAITAYQLLHMLLHSPGLIVASSNYNLARLYGVWEWLTPQRLAAVRWGGVAVAAVLVAFACARLATAGAEGAAALLAAPAVLAALAGWLLRDREPQPVPAAAGNPQRPNVLMIGCDTLRPDRIGAHGYERDTTPFLDGVIARGTSFRRCYVPLARTAPSLVSLFTGCWPHRHGVRFNYVADDERCTGVPALPRELARLGYRTVAVSDWCGSDLGKFDLGFQELDLPADQWNLKYLIRQGPKDIRLFLSLFLHNRVGKRLLPELYYLAGVPLGAQLGREARRRLGRLSREGQPFLLNLFTSHTHPPFASDYPYYLRFSNPGYRGESKFAMRRLTDPFEVIRSQAEPKKAFDLDQINALYDGAVCSFDDEVRRTLGYLEACGLAENTIVVLYGDHGMDLFEHNTWGQGNSIIGDSNRIPLVIVDPRRRGRGVIDPVVRSVDVFPTLLEMIGAAPPEADGHSLLPCIEGRVADLDLPAFAETGMWLTRIPGMHPEHLDYPSVLELLEVPNPATGTLAVKAGFRERVNQARDRMVVAGRWKLVCLPLRTGPRHELYDLVSDPQCRHDVASVHPEVVEALTRLLHAWALEANGAAMESAARTTWPEERPGRRAPP